MVKLIALEWYNGVNGYMEPNCPTLAVVFDNGRAQLMRHELDDGEWVMLSRPILWRGLLCVSYM